MYAAPGASRARDRGRRRSQDAIEGGNLMRPDQLRFSAYEVHVLRSILRDWRESNLIPTTPIPDHDLDVLEDRLNRVEVDVHEALARAHMGASDHHHPPVVVGLGAPGDVHHPLSAPGAAMKFSVEP
jgi:hypothetical protein